MAFDNVIPIDAESARLLARRHVRFRWLVGALTAVWLAVLVPAVLCTPLPPLGPFLVLAVLVILAEHRFVLFGDETSMSASIIVIVASVFVFESSSPIVGPMLVASLGGLYLPHLRTRAFAKLAINTAGMSLSSFAAAIAAVAVRGTGNSGFVEACSVFAAVLGYWLVNNLVVAGHQATACGQPYVRSAWLLITSDTDVLVWAGVASVSAVPLGALTGCGAIAVAVGGRVLYMAVLDSQRLSERGSRLTLNTYALLIWLVTVALAAFNGEQYLAAVGVGYAIALGFQQLTRPPELWSCVLATATIASAPPSGWISAVLVLSASAMVLCRTRNRCVSWTACVTSGAALCSVLLQLGARLPATLLVIAPLAIAALLDVSLLFAKSRVHDGWAALGLFIPGRSETLAIAMAAVSVTVCETAPVLALGCSTAFFLVTCLLAYRPTKFGRRFSLNAASPS